MRLNDKPAGIPLTQCPTKTALALDPKASTKDPGAVCRKFEGFLLGELFKQMRGGESSGQGILPVSRAERIFQGQQCEVLGDLLAEREPLGLARLLRPQMNEKQTTEQDSRCNSVRTGGTTDAH